MDDIVDRIIQYEEGELGVRESVKLFSDLIKNRIVWQLQGSYGRTADSLIKSGVINMNGDIDYARLDTLLQDEE
jgi:uncharacterized protein YbcI